MTIGALYRSLLGTVATLTLSACTVPPAAERAAPPIDELSPTLDAMFEEVRERYSLPGLALGVVRDDEVIYARTAGETIAGSGEPITPDTLFKIASNSKAMTTGVLAKLVDAGQLRWDDPVTRHLPQFRMHDPWVTREIQVRDLLIHNSGLRAGAGDLMLWPEPNSFTRADIIAGLAHLKPQHSFRSRYDYDNLLYVVAGEVAAAAAGVSYEELVRRELFVPLEMHRCRVGVWRRDEVGNVAQPHMLEGGQNVVIRADPAVIPLSTSAAAGGIRCSLNDMLKWVRMWLDPELRAPGGEPWLSPEQRTALWSAHTPMPISERQRRSDGSRFNAYGYGWRVSDVEGVLRVAHTGTLAGMYSAVTLLPEKNTGFVFMINGEGSRARTVLNTALGRLFATPERRQPLAHYADALERESSEQAPSDRHAPPARRAPERASLDPWLGAYRDPWFGEITLCERDGVVEFSSKKSPRLKGVVMQAGERLLVDWNEASIDAEAWLDFAASEGGPPRLAMSKVDPLADFSYDYEDLSFTRVGGCTEATPRASGGEDAVSSKIDALMRAYQGAVPGAAVLVVHRGVPVVRAVYGMADLEAGIAVGPATNFRLASVTKQFTAAAILLLAREGRVQLDEPASKWFPSLPPAVKGVTIRHLLTHTSGLIDYEDVMPEIPAAQLRDADVLQLLEAQNRTYFPPGTAYRYSNSAYALLALIVGSASGSDFATFLRERIFEPLGMRASVAFEDGRSAVSERAFGYTLIDGAWARTDQSPTSAVLGDGGIYSSIDDLAKWDAALSAGSLLPKDLLAAAFTPATATDDPDVRYGFGWRITGDTVWHSGETVGFRNVIVRDIGRELTVAVLTNRNDPEPYGLALEIAGAMTSAITSSRSP